MMKFEGTEIPTIIIPKNTLLFRASKHSESDFVGVDVKHKLCIPPNYNVFFYYTPFAVDSVKWYDDIRTIEVCRTTHDIEVVSMINPSPFDRGSRFKDQPFMLNCDSDKLKKTCLNGKSTDPCFRETFLKEFPEISGWTALAATDSKQLQIALKGKLKNYKQWIPLVKDKRGIEGTAEIALYPLIKRRTEDIFIDHPEEFKSNSTFNYEFITTLSRSCSDREKFMKDHAILKDGKFQYKD